MRFKTRDVRYSLWRTLSCSAGEASTDGWVDWVCGVSGRELLLLEVFVLLLLLLLLLCAVFGSGRSEDGPLLIREPLRDM